MQHTPALLLPCPSPKTQRQTIHRPQSTGAPPPRTHPPTGRTRHAHTPHTPHSRPHRLPPTRPAAADQGLDTRPRLAHPPPQPPQPHTAGQEASPHAPRQIRKSPKDGPLPGSQTAHSARRASLSPPTTHYPAPRARLRLRTGRPSSLAGLSPARRAQRTSHQPEPLPRPRRRAEPPELASRLVHGPAAAARLLRSGSGMGPSSSQHTVAGPSTPPALPPPARGQELCHPRRSPPELCLPERLPPEPCLPTRSPPPKPSLPLSPTAA
jgi:hypothetical protein